MLLVFPTSIRDAVHLAQLCGAPDNHAEAGVDAWFRAVVRKKSVRPAGSSGIKNFGACNPELSCAYWLIG
jgi:hypothetical protein